MRSIVYGLVFVVACSPSRPSQTPDSNQQTIDAAPSLCYEPSTSGTVTPGTSTLDSCAVWNSVSKMSGAVTLTRDPSHLTMAFATGPTFVGTVAARNVNLTYFHLHDFSDGCKWRATETLTGDLDPASCVMTLSYHYVESVETSDGSCATPCTGTGSFSLQIAPIL